MLMEEKQLQKHQKSIVGLVPNAASLFPNIPANTADTKISFI